MAPIHAITVTRLKTFVILGHSNADGWAPYINVIAAHPDYAPKSDPVTNQAEAYYKNVYVATSEQAFPETRGTPVVSTPGAVDWLEMTVANPIKTTDDHPHSSPYNYPNNRGSCYPRWLYQAWRRIGIEYASGNSYPLSPTPASLTDTPTANWWNQLGTPDLSSPDANQIPFGVLTGLELPFSWIWKSYWQEQVGMVKVAFSSSLFLPEESGNTADAWLDPVLLGAPGRNYGPTPDFTPGYVRSAVDGTYGHYAYWTPGDAFDFAPGTDRLYKMWFDKMVGAAAALGTDANGNQIKMDVQIVIPWLGDNDANTRTQNILENSWENTCRAFIKRIRKDLVDNDWTTLPEHQIPIMWPSIRQEYTSGPNESPGFVAASYANGILNGIAADDLYVKVLNSDAWKSMTESGDQVWFFGGAATILDHDNHVGSSGYPEAAKAIFDAWLAIQTDPLDALDQDETITVDEARAKIRTYYGRARSNTDIDDTTVLQHLNAAMYHCLNHCGDNAWWLRRRDSIRVTAGPNQTITMPRYVHRLMKIEEPGNLTVPVQFEQVGFIDGGKLQIVIKERGTGTYNMQFITMPKELTRGDEILPAPRNICEWIVVEACSRLAGSGTNAAMQGHFAGQAQQLMSDSLRSMGQMQRSKRDRLRTQRRNTILGYSRQNYNTWDRGSSA